MGQMGLKPKNRKSGNHWTREHNQNNRNSQQSGSSAGALTTFGAFIIILLVALHACFSR